MPHVRVMMCESPIFKSDRILPWTTSGIYNKLPIKEILT